MVANQPCDHDTIAAMVSRSQDFNGAHPRLSGGQVERGPVVQGTGITTPRHSVCPDVNSSMAFGPGPQADLRRRPVTRLPATSAAPPCTVSSAWSRCHRYQGNSTRPCDGVLEPGDLHGDPGRVAACGDGLGVLPGRAVSVSGMIDRRASPSTATRAAVWAARHLPAPPELHVAGHL